MSTVHAVLSVIWISYTLFPYTTLFRSEERRVGKECTGKDEDVPEEPIEIDEPEEEADLGFGDDDDFSLDLPSAATVTPEAKKTAGVAARP